MITVNTKQLAQSLGIRNNNFRRKLHIHCNNAGIPLDQYIIPGERHPDYNIPLSLAREVVSTVPATNPNKARVLKHLVNQIPIKSFNQFYQLLGEIFDELGVPYQINEPVAKFTVGMYIPDKDLVVEYGDLTREEKTAKEHSIKLFLGANIKVLFVTGVVSTAVAKVLGQVVTVPKRSC